MAPVVRGPSMIVHEVDEQRVSGAILAETGEPIDLYVLSTEHQTIMVEVPAGEEPDVQKMHGPMAKLLAAGNDVIFLAKVLRRYSRAAGGPVVARESSRVQ